jgi:hypothetical protein
MSSLPTRTDISGSPSKATAQAAFTALFDFVAQRLAFGTAGVTAASAAELRTTRESLGLGGGLPSPIINAGWRVQQRAASALGTTWRCGKADRLQARVLGGTGLAGAIDVTALAGVSSGIAAGIVGGSWTSGQAQLGYTVQALDASYFNGRTVTVSGKLNHNFGSTRDFTVQLVKANTANDFSAYTVIATSAATSVPTSTTTALSLTATLGATDASNGLGIIVSDNAANTVSSKSCVFGDLNLVAGSVAGDVPFCHYDTDLANSRAFYESGSAGEFLNNTGSTATMSALITFKTKKVQTPIAVSAAVGALQNLTSEWMSYYQLAIPSGTYYQPGTYTADAELYLS